MDGLAVLPVNDSTDDTLVCSVVVDRIDETVGEPTSPAPVIPRPTNNFATSLADAVITLLPWAPVPVIVVPYLAEMAVCARVVK
jgi:hypothetical protein